jgi:fatty-acyl-CoA synthase
MPGSYAWEDVFGHATSVMPEELAFRQRDQEFDAPVNIQYTSGTTGTLKGATLSHHSILNKAIFVGDYLGLTERDRLCVTLPFYHSGGMVVSALACLVKAAAIVLPAAVFEAGATLETIEREHSTILNGVPTMFDGRPCFPAC